MSLTQTELVRKAGTLAIQGITADLPKFIKRVTDAFKAKGLTLTKLVRMYSVIEKAVSEIEAIIKEK